jgi:hypothetical protein
MSVHPSIIAASFVPNRLWKMYSISLYKSDYGIIGYLLFGVKRKNYGPQWLIMPLSPEFVIRVSAAGTLSFMYNDLFAREREHEETLEITLKVGAV